MADPFDDSLGWTRFDYGASDGLQLAGRKYGFSNTQALPVVCLAGLTRNSADFHELAMHLAYRAARPRPVLALDYRGRGMSAHDKNWQNYNVMTEADDVVSGAIAAGINKAAVIGTSRGALITMVLAATKPGLLQGVVMNDAGPQIEGLGLVRIRSYIEKSRDFDNWSSAVAAIKAIGSGHFPKWDDAMWAVQARRIYSEAGGRIVRRYDPALMKTLTAINLDNPLATLWPQFGGLTQIPMLVIRGGNSDLLSIETLAKMQSLHPRMQIATVPDQGHAPDLGTDLLPQRIETFLAGIETAH